MSKLKVNKFGKLIADKGYKSIAQLIAENDLKVNYSTLHNWVTKKSTVFPQSLNVIDDIASALDSTRIDILNMISTDPIYDATFIKNYSSRNTKNKSKLQLLRETAGYNASEVASAISTETDIVDAQFVYDIENGKRRNFPSSTIMKNYMELFDLSFVKLYEYQDEACKDYNEADRKARGTRTGRNPNVSELGKIRCDLGLTVRKVADSIGIDNQQFITDLEHGRRSGLPTDEVRDKYLALMGISLEEFESIVSRLTKERLEQFKKDNKNMIDKIYGGYDEEAIEKRDKAMAEFDKKYEVTHMDNEAIITPKEDVEVNPWVDIFKKTGESQKNIERKLPAEDMQRVMSVLYGKVDFNTFKTIENILMGVN